MICSLLLLFANTESLSDIQSARIELRAVLLQSVRKQSVIAFSLDPVTRTSTAVDNNNRSSVILPSNTHQPSSYTWQGECRF